jgi:hypothetical protein
MAKQSRDPKTSRTGVALDDLSLRFDFDGQWRPTHQQNQERGLVVVETRRATRLAGGS